jgi:hypothetical protein
MNIPGKIASIVLILIGAGWLVSLFSPWAANNNNGNNGRATNNLGVATTNQGLGLTPAGQNPATVGTNNMTTPLKTALTGNTTPPPRPLLRPPPFKRLPPPPSRTKSLVPLKPIKRSLRQEQAPSNSRHHPDRQQRQSRPCQLSPPPQHPSPLPNPCALAGKWKLVKC